jgi:hypothetical protein
MSGRPDGTLCGFGFSTATAGNRIVIGAQNRPGGGKKGAGAALVFGG